MKIEINTLPPEVAKLIEQTGPGSVELVRDGKNIATLMIHDDSHNRAFARALEIVKINGNDAQATKELRQEFMMLGLVEARNLILRARAHRD